MDKYCLPDKYVHRTENTFFDDTPFTDEYQYEVYDVAFKTVVNHNFNSILDIGTGGGYKLIKYFSDYNTLGIDIEPTLSFLRTKYPDRNWGKFEDIDSEFDLVICSDVIEHIPEPDGFIKNILELEFKMIVFSTPDRDTLYGGVTVGPPSNTAHVREWTINEFFCYISKYFKIVNQYKFEPNTQVVLCKKI